MCYTWAYLDTFCGSIIGNAVQFQDLVSGHGSSFIKVAGLAVHFVNTCHHMSRFICIAGQPGNRLVYRRHREYILFISCRRKHCQGTVPHRRRAYPPCRLRRLHCHCWNTARNIHYCHIHNLPEGSAWWTAQIITLPLRALRRLGGSQLRIENISAILGRQKIGAS